MEMFMPEFVSNARDLYEKLTSFYNKDQLYLKKSRKPKASANTLRPQNRSRYIGVAKNGVKWQTLVCYKKQKIFLGNYDTEEEAADIVDLFSILTKGRYAKVNRDYTVDQVLVKIWDFINKS